MTLSVEPYSDAGCRVVEHCPYCGGEGSAAVSGRDQVSSDGTYWRYSRCQNCGALWLKTVPNDLSPYYPADYYTHSPAVLGGRIRALVVQAVLAARYGFPASGTVRYLSQIMRAIPVDTGASRFLMHVEHGKALDVGCGSGDFLYSLHLYGWEATGIEPDERAARVCSDRGIKTIHADAENAVVPANYFDAITLHHSLEHMRNPAAVITRLAKALKPGGKLVVVTPNASGFLSRRFGPHWRSLDPPRHLSVATAKALRLTMERAGLVPDIRTASTNVRWVCRASAALRDRGSLRLPPSRLKVLGLTIASKVAAALDHSAGEEIICIAMKPGRNSPGDENL